MPEVRPSPVPGAPSLWEYCSCPQVSPTSLCGVQEYDDVAKPLRQSVLLWRDQGSIGYSLSLNRPKAARRDRSVPLITHAEMEALPDDPGDAFVAFYDIVSNRMSELDEKGDVGRVLKGREEFSALMVGAARQFGLDVQRFDLRDNNYSEIHRYSLAQATQLRLSSTARRATMLAVLGQGPKARLRHLLSDLETALEASDLPEVRKKVLRAKLAEFAAELEKPQSNIGKMLAVIALVAAALGQAEDLVIKLPKTVEAVMKIIGEAKDEELPQPSPAAAAKGEPVRAIEGPKS